MRHLSCLCLALAFAACSQGSNSGGSAPPPLRPFGIELVVRTSQNFHSPADVSAFVDAAARHGVATIDLLVKQDEDAGANASGGVYYRSRLAPAAPGYEQFDVLQAMLDAAHAKHLRVRAWVPQFHDQVAARHDADWAMRALVSGQVVPYTGSSQTEYFVNPLNAAVQDYELAIVAEVVAGYAVDGVMLDWIRFDDFDMDLGDATRARYQALGNPDPLTIDFGTASTARDRWNAFRTDAVAAYVARVRAAVPPAMDLGVYILPPEFVEVGQDAAKFNAQAGLLSPMCYFRDWQFSIDWVWNSCLATTVAKAGAAPIVPAMDSGLEDAQYQQILDHLRSGFPQIRTLAWFHHERWTEAMMARIAALSTR